MQCKEWDDANSELFKESHDAAVQKNSYKGRLCELMSASLKSGGSAKSQENPASTLLLSSGNAGSCCKGWYPCFCDGLSYFLRICRIRFSFPVPGEREGENQEPVYRDSWFLSVKAAFRPELSRYTWQMGNRILPWKASSFLSPTIYIA